MKSLSAFGAARPCSCFTQTSLRFFFLSIFLTGIFASAQALDYYWVGGSGMWSDHNNHWATTSGGNVFHDQVPQSMDNVYFDANSFPAGGTVVIDPTIIYCMDMDWTGAGNMPVFEGPGDKQVWIYGSLTLIGGMDWKVFGEVHFRAFQVGKTITSAGREFVTDVYFDGAGGEWMLLDAFHVNRGLRHSDGGLYTNGQDVTVGNLFASDGSPARKLHFGSSNIYVGIAVYNHAYFYFQMGASPFDFDAGASTIYMKNGAFYTTFFYGGNQTYNNLICEAQINILDNNNFHAATFLKNASISGNNHYDILTLTTGQVYALAGGSTQTINPGGTFNGNGSCMDFVTIASYPAGIAAQIEKTTGTAALSYVVLQDIHAIGGATFSATNSADLGNNSGWAFLPSAPRHLYWVGGGGDWNDASHWSLLSGGAGGECIPTPFDNVFFDQGAGFTLSGQQININVPVAFCQDMDWTGVLNSPVLIGAQQNKLFIFGSLKFVTDMSLTFSGEVHFMAHTTGQTITSAGKEFVTDVYFDGTGGEWMLLDAFHVNRGLRHSDGGLYTNGQDVTVGNLFASDGSPARKLHFGSSNIYVGIAVYNYAYFYFQMGAIPFDFDASTSTIYMKNGAFYTTFFYGGNQTYNNLICEAQINILDNNNFHAATFLKNASISGNNHYDILTLTTGQAYALAGGSTQTINPGGTFNGNGSCMDFVTIASYPAGIAAQIEKTTGTAALSYVVLQDIHAIGGATFSATNSADLGNNSGWAFLPSAPRHLYWVGGGGDWNDASHWSLLSGGAGGECIPTPFDNVFFDQGAGFTLSGQQININVPVAFCQDMDWTGVLNSPVLIGAQQNKLFIFGSLKFVTDMSLTFSGEVHFMAHTTGQTITSAGKEFVTDVYFDGTGGEWMLLDAFHVNRGLRHSDGGLYTNGQDVMVGNLFASDGSPARKLHFGSSNIYVGIAVYNYAYFYFQMGAIPFDFDASTSTIYMKNGAFYTTFFYGGNQTYNNLICEAQINILDNNNFHSTTFLKNASISGNNVFQYLTFSPGNTYIFQSGTTQTITPLGNFIAEGTGSFPIEIKSSSLGQQAIVHKDGDPICLDFLYLTDIAATGTGFRYAGANSDNVSNNSGWLFEACPGCFNGPAGQAPTLDPGSTTAVQPGQLANLILANLPGGSEAVWFDGDKTTELYASESNTFQPMINQGTKFYGAFRDLSTGCVSDVVEVLICPEISFTLTATPPACVGGTNGSLEVSNALGLGSPVTYTITGGSPQNSSLFTGLGAGTYTVMAQDASTCSANQTVNLPDGMLAGQSLGITCPGSVPNLQGGSNCQAALGDYTGLAVVTGNCGGPLNPVVQSPPPGTLVNPGTVAVHLTVSNQLGESVTCVFNVGILGGCH